MLLHYGNIFAYVSSALIILAIFSLPKRLNRKEIYTTWFVMAAFTINTDLVLGVVFDLYDFINPDISLNDLVLQFILAPSAGVLVLNFQPKKRIKFILYLSGVLCFAIFFEWLATLFGYLVYKGWRLWYSIPFYLLGMLYLKWHLNFLRK
ncbi:CBO0543 family protein [Paenibacillus sp. S-38]|uniref:CBO0543 family protein n=1 Tax=Paenibacillus sp. S-38 TaxID=3416710 RepID=UPI003CE90E1E